MFNQLFNDLNLQLTNFNDQFTTQFSETTESLSLNDLLKELKLEKYKDSLEENGCESIDDLLDTTEEELNELCKECNIPILKAKKLKKKINQLRPNNNSYSNTSHSSKVSYSVSSKTTNYHQSYSSNYPKQYHTISKVVSKKIGGGNTNYHDDEEQEEQEEEEEEDYYPQNPSFSTKMVSKNTNTSQICPRCGGKGNYNSRGWADNGKKGKCALCNGKCEVSGTFYQCWKCKGKGLFDNRYTPRDPWIVGHLTNCHVCSGKGYKQTKGYKCPQCRGKGYYGTSDWEEKNTKAHVHKGTCLLCKGTEVKHKNYSKCFKCKGNGFFDSRNKPQPIWSTGQFSTKCSLCDGGGWR